MSEWTAETAEWYAEHYGEYATNRVAVDRLELAPDATVLDIGCGTGAALRHAAGRVTRGRLIGVDPVPRMLEIARERAEGVAIEFHEGSAARLPVDDAQCDVVLALDSLDHWSDVAVGLAEVRRVLAPGGRLVLVKDASVPATHPHREALEAAGFSVDNEAHVEAEGVAFDCWLASAAG